MKTQILMLLKTLQAGVLSLSLWNIRDEHILICMYCIIRSTTTNYKSICLCKLFPWVLSVLYMELKCDSSKFLSANSMNYDRICLWDYASVINIINICETAVRSLRDESSYLVCIISLLILQMVLHFIHLWCLRCLLISVPLLRASK